MQLEYEGALDSWVQLIISKKYETLFNLYQYDMEDYLGLFELVLINTVNEALAMNNIQK